MTNDKDITLADIFDHLRGQSIRIDALQKQVKEGFERMYDNFKSINKRFDIVDERFDEIEKRLEHLEQDVFVLVAHKKANQERLDTIEKIKLPRINRSIRSIQKRFKVEKEENPHSKVRA